MIEAMSPPIPSRVKCNVPLIIKESPIDGAGRGLFISGDAEAGQLIFSIPEPLLNIISDGEEALQTTCDNCLATTLGKLCTVPLKNRKLNQCPACKILSYCSKKCKEQAWEHHHKYECSNLASITRSIYNNEPVVNLASIRMMIRLTSLKVRGKIADDEWAEYTSLTTFSEAQKPAVMSDHYFTALGKNADFVSQNVKKCKLPRETMLHLQGSMPTNQVSMPLPLLKENDPYNSDCTYSVGMCMEPFVALLNHSCAPNVWWVYEGKELRVRAQRSIKAGEELFVNYQGGERNFTTRRDVLKKSWGFVCTCSLCRKGDPGPKGLLGEHVWELYDSQVEKSQRKEHLDDLEAALTQMKLAGLGLDNWAVRSLRDRASAYYFFLDMDDKRLEFALEDAILYPHHEPYIRITDFFWLNQTVDSLVAASRNSIGEEFEQFLDIISWQLKAKQVGEINTWFGSETMVAGSARKVFSEITDAPDYETVNSAEEEAKFVINTNRLLKMANLPNLVEIHGP